MGGVLIIKVNVDFFVQGPLFFDQNMEKCQINWIDLGSCFGTLVYQYWWWRNCRLEKDGYQPKVVCKECLAQFLKEDGIKDDSDKCSTFFPVFPSFSLTYKYSFVSMMC